MSSSILIALWPGEKKEEVKQLHNSWGTGAVVWDDISSRYLGMHSHPWLLPGPKQQALWDAWKDPRIPLSARAVLMFTFDRAYVVAMDYQRFAGDLRNYIADCTCPEGHVNHLPAIADFFECLPDYPAVGLWVTTVTSNPFEGEYNEEEDRPEPFNWSAAFDIYTELDGLDRKPAA